MALRGETVGTAFVRILAEGSGLDQSIKDQMRQHESAFEQAGETDSEAYNKGFEDELKRQGAFADLEKLLAKRAGKFDAVGSIAGDKYGTGFLSRLDELFKGRFGDEVGERLSRELTERIVSQQSAAEIKKFVSDIGVHAIAVTKQIQREESEAVRQIDVDFERSFRNIINETDQMADEAERAAERYRLSFIRAGDDVETSFGKVARQFEADVDRIARDNDRLRASFGESERNISGLSVVIGRTFGKGSRNNFLNWFGTVVGGLSNLIEKIPGLRALLGPLSADFSKMTQTGSGFFETIFEGGLASGVTKLGASFAGLAIVFAGFITLLGPIISLFAGLAGGIIAMAGSIAFALAAGLPVLVGGLAAVAGTIGVAVAAFSSLDKAQKKALSESLQPLLDTFKELGRTMAGPVLDALNDVIPLVEDAVKAFEPFARPLGRALADGIRTLAGVLDTPAFRQFAEAFGTFLPDAMRTLFEIIGNLSRVLFGLFRGSIPVAEDFLGWVERITDQFANWINSARGQRSVREFFDDAAASAKVVGDLIADIAEAVGKLLAGGRETGDTLLGDIDTKVEEFIRFLDEHPDTLKDWFGRAEETTRNVGKIIDAIATILDTLDTAGSSGAANFVLLIVDKFLELANVLIRVSDGFIILLPPVGALIILFKTWGEIIGRIPEIFDDIVDGIGGFFSRLGGAFSPARFAGLIQPAAIFSAILHRLPDIDLSRIFDVAHVVSRILGSLPDPRDLIAHMAFDILNVVQGLGSLAHDILSKLPNPVDFIQSMAFDLINIVRGLGSFAGQLLNAFPSMADILQRFPTADDIIRWIGDVSIDIIAHVIPDLPEGFSWSDLNPLTHLPGGLAGGTRNFAGGLALVGEKGPELAVLPKGTDVIPNDQTRRLLGGKSIVVESGAITIVTPTEDPVAVATEFLNQLVATSYL